MESAYGRLPFPPPVRKLFLIPNVITYELLTIKLEDRFDVRLGFFEDHLTGFPGVLI